MIQDLLNKIRLNALAVLSVFAVAGVFMIAGQGDELGAETCAAITGDLEVDAACCVDPAMLSYTDAYGDTTHDAYVSCIATAVIELRLLGDVSEPGAEDLIVEKASASSVNK